MPDLTFKEILENENAMLMDAQEKLAVFDREVEAIGDQTAEEVYSSLLTALDSAKQSYANLLDVVSRIEQATAQNRIAFDALPPTMVQHAQSFQNPNMNAAAANKIIISLWLCAQRPTDVWRGEIRKQASALLQRLHVALANNADATSIMNMTEVYTSVFCWFEQAWFDKSFKEEKGFLSTLFSWKGLGTVAAAATAGYFGGNYLVPVVSGYLGYGSGGEIDDGGDDDVDLLPEPEVESATSPITVDAEFEEVIA